MLERHNCVSYENSSITSFAYVTRYVIVVSLINEIKVAISYRGERKRAFLGVNSNEFLLFFFCFDGDIGMPANLFC